MRADRAINSLLFLFVSVVFAEDPPEKLQLDFANGLYQREYYPMAAEEYRKWLQEYPDAAGADEAWFRLGDSLRSLKQNEEAIKTFQAMTEKYPDSPRWQKAKFRIGELNYVLQKYPDATAHLNALVPRATDRDIKAAALFFLGKIQYDQGQLDPAAQALLTLAQSGEAGAYAGYSYFTLAQIALKKNDPEKALTYFKATLDSKPSETLLPETHYEVARLESNRRNYAASAAGYEKVLKEYGQSPYVAASVNGLVAALFQDSKWEPCIAAVNQYSDRAAPEAQGDLLYLAANAQRRLNQWDTAIATYDQLAQKYSTWDRLDAALSELVRCYYEKQDWAKVVSSAGEFLNKFPQSSLGSSVALLAAEVQFSQKKYADAGKLYDVVLTGFPKSAEAPDAGYRKAWTVLLQEQWPQSSAAFRSFVQSWPQDQRVPEALVRSAQSQQRAGNFAEAIKDYTVFNEKYPNNNLSESAVYQLGLCYGELKQFDEMTKALTAFVQKFPNSTSQPEANYWLGWNAYRGKQWAQAVPFLTKALESPTRAKDAKLKLALSYFSLDQAANAAPLVKEFLKTDTAKEIPLQVYRWLGEFHANAGQYAEALPEYEQMAALVDASANKGWAVTAQLGVGQSALALQRYDVALPALEKVVELAPESAQAIDAFIAEARVFLATKKFAEGETVLSKVLTLQPEGRENARARMLLGEVLMAQSKFVEAAKHFQTVSLLFDDPEVTPQAMARAARCFESAGQIEAARKTLDELKQKYPKFQAQ
ncbi:MAG: tetratricopeptide repeat protein [Verrucomicrobiae bacterium]|nr:tetratricopeptide repeat protein [Verrucomicrobiae bacterium]